MNASKIPVDVMQGDPCCARCVYWMPIARRERPPLSGECHRRPPLVTAATRRDLWPTVGPEQWCGDFEEMDYEE